MGKVVGGGKTVESSRRSLTSVVMRDALAVGDPNELATKAKKAKKERAVLEEDEYLAKLDSIIQRDFYPDIPKLRAQAEYLEAVEANDVAKIRQLQLKFSSRRTEPRQNSPTLRSRSPTAGAGAGAGSSFDVPTPLATPTHNPDAPPGAVDAAAAPPKDTVPEAKDLRLDAFLRKYNSEDNAAFEGLQDIDDKRHKIKHGWMYRAELKHNREKILFGPNSIAPKPADEQAALEYQRPKEVDGWAYKARNRVLFMPEEVPLSAEEEVERAKLKPPEISHTNTRFKVAPFSEAHRKEALAKAGIIQATANKGRFDALGNEERGFHSGALGHLVTPSPMPGAGGDSPMMTWGEIDGTPFRLDASDTPLLPSQGPGFRIPDVPHRDRLAHSMTSEIAERHRLKKAKALTETRTIGGLKRTPTPQQRLASLSPAARRLASNKLGIRLGTDSGLRAAYSPSPLRRAPSTPSSAASSAKASPALTRPDKSSITDGLLNLPKDSAARRTRASDFF